MKSSSLSTKILMAVICLVVLSYFGLQGYRYFANPLTTTPCYAYQVEESISANGFVVREEQVLPDAASGLLRLSRGEGEKVSKGGEIARIYADQASLDRQAEIDSLQAQAEQLRYARDAALGSEASLKLDTQIMESLLRLRSEVTAGRLDGADDKSSALRALVMKRDYTYAGTDDLETRLTDISAQLKTLTAQSGSSVKTVTAPVAGIYSAVVDGYESALTPETVETLKPSELLAVEPDGESSGLGKLILGDAWYYAAVMNASDAEALRVGGQETLRFTKGESRELEVTVFSIGKEENGRAVVVFRGRSYLSEITMLREQSADVIEKTVQGLRVPQNALRVNEEGESGLYCVVGMIARFKPVKVLYNGEGFALVEAASEVDKSRLRSGDEVIVTANGLYDGMVVDEIG